MLYARVDGDGRVRVVDTLGLALPAGVPSTLALLSAPGALAPAGGGGAGGAEGAPPALALDPASAGRASHDVGYAARVCDLNGAVARCNADVSGPEALRCEGKVLVLASVHSTFPRPATSETLWVSVADFAAAHRIRSRCLTAAVSLPSQLEYLDAGAYGVIDRSGRGLCLAISAVGIGPVLRRMWDAKLWVESLPGCATLVDLLLYWVNPVLPAALPASIAALGAQHGHHLIVTLDTCAAQREYACARARDSLLWARSHARVGCVL